MEIDIKGYKVLIDDEDYEKVIARKWHLHTNNFKKHHIFYFLGYIEGSTVLLHRFIMKLQLNDGKIIDHINGNTLDNRKKNLRICTIAENNRNTKRSKKNTSGYKGVSFMNGKYYARIRVNGRRIWLGYYNTSTEAYKAYCNASKLYHSEYGHI